MGILGIRNRTENWKTAHSFGQFFKSSSARAALAKRLLEPLGKSYQVEAGTVKIELFWYGMRDYLKRENIKIEDMADDFAQTYKKCFPKLRNTIDEFNGFKNLKEQNYDASKKYPTKKSDKLSDNLFNTEIDVVIETPTHLFIGEAKYEEKSFETEGDYVLVHQLIRQYVMTTILFDLIPCDKQVVPFAVGASDKLASLKNTDQVKFMIDQGWLKEENVLSWDCIDEIAKSAPADN